MRFCDTLVLFVPRDGARLQWLVEPEDTDLSLVELDVERSESPKGPFENLQTLDPSRVFSFVDRTVPWRPKNWELYYRLVARSRSTGEIVASSHAFGMQGELPLDAIEIIRQHNILLQGINGHPSFTGIDCTIYKRRTFGARCRSCVDASTGRVTISQCRVCGGTGFEKGGYYDPVNAPMSFQPNPRQSRITNLGRLEDNETMAFMTNFPIMSPGDVVVEPSERHWRVNSIDVTERKRVVVHQQLRLEQVDHNDVIYETLPHSSHRS
jgi:hypothetical protein